MKTLKKQGAFHVVSMVLVVLGAVLFLYPIFWLATNSFKTQQEIYRLPPTWWPEFFTMENYVHIFRYNPALIWIKNSVLTSVMMSGLTVMTGTMAAYAFSKLRFSFKRGLYIVFILSIMIPTEILIIPLFRITSALNLVDTSFGMAAPGVASAVGLFMMKGFLDSLPDSIRESAKMDGAGEVRTFVSIMLPLCRAGMSALFILTFVRSWNNYLWQMLMASGRMTQTLTVGISTLFMESDPNIGYKIAGAMVGAVPMLLIFFAFQKYFTKGVAVGAEKG